MEPVTTVIAIVVGGAIVYFALRKPKCPTDAQVRIMVADIDSGKTTLPIAESIAMKLEQDGCGAAAAALRATAAARKLREAAGGGGGSGGKTITKNGLESSTLEIPADPCLAVLDGLPDSTFAYSSPTIKFSTPSLRKWATNVYLTSGDAGRRYAAEALELEAEGAKAAGASSVGPSSTVQRLLNAASCMRGEYPGSRAHTLKPLFATDTTTGMNPRARAMWRR